MMSTRVGGSFALAGLVALATVLGGACRSGAGRPSDGAGGGAPAAIADGVVVRLERLHEGDGALVFGVPVAKGAVADVAAVRVRDPRSKAALAGAAIAP